MSSLPHAPCSPCPGSRSARPRAIPCSPCTWACLPGRSEVPHPLSRHDGQRIRGEVDTTATVMQDKPQKHNSRGCGRLPWVFGRGRSVAFITPGHGFAECAGGDKPGNPKGLTMIHKGLRRRIEDWIRLCRIGRPRGNQAYGLTGRKRIERSRRVAHQGRQRHQGWILVCGVACAEFLRHHERSACKTTAQPLAEDGLLRAKIKSKWLVVAPGSIRVRGSKSSTT